MHKNDIKTGSPGKQNVIEVPIFEDSNFGEKMAIDEKHIGEDFYTIESNRDIGKIAMLCDNYNFTGLGQVLIGHPSILPKVKRITRDFSALFNKLCDRLFCDAVQVGHKFNIIRLWMEANQAIRIKIRQKELQKRREAFNEFKGIENYGWKNANAVGKNLSPGNSTTRKHGLKMGRPRWNCRPGAGTSFLVPPSMEAQTEDKGQCPV